MIAPRKMKGKGYMFSVGQRWLSETENELGLGIVIECQNRFVTLSFPTTGEDRRYTTQDAPLTRIVFSEGDTISCAQGWTMTVEEVSVQDDLVVYFGHRDDTGEWVELSEVLLNHTFTLNQPKQRLLAGQVDNPNLFALRHQCLQKQFEHFTSPLLGFLGARADLIPHQLHIASEVGQRFAPRVLLADEVGLGKTIEAALIIHQQIQSGRASRVLIIVPSSLVHQWLVEMLRRVNLAFSIFDHERYASAKQEGNPFEMEQLVICSLDFVTHEPDALQDMEAAGWDLLIVDEAHHLQWSADGASAEYDAIAALAASIPGVLLLTATPDQLGHESHFARLRLLDPNRFHSYSEFLAEEKAYSKIADIIEPLQSDAPLTQNHIDRLSNTLGETTVNELLSLPLDQAKPQLIEQLLDRHGTGRLLFRNSRKGVTGFKQRKLNPYPLPLPEHYKSFMEHQDVQHALYPEQNAPDLLMDDPRLPWLIQLLQQLKQMKVLVICAKASTALGLSEAIRVKSGIRTTVFHEGMSILERDQSASYFAQQDYGAQALICSEIGSEGRNFQFASHLVLFDLPLNPDLLEQRIGRLDRIGQKNDIQIHVPYFEDSPQAILLDWYHKGLNSFEQTCPTGRYVYQAVSDQLAMALDDYTNTALHNALIADTAERHRAARERLEQGRDKLLEINSSGTGKVETLIQGIRDKDDDPSIEKFMTSLFDGIGVLQEDNNESTYILKPTESMQSALPGLDEDGLTVTYEREAALAQEHIQFLTWDHPMVRHAMDSILTDTQGKSTIAMSQIASQPVGAFWVEFVFVLRAVTDKNIPVQRYFPATPVRFKLDSQKRPVNLSFGELRPVKKSMAKSILKALTPQIESACDFAESLIGKKMESIQQTHIEKMQQQLDGEHQRLLALQAVNPSIRDEEIEYLTQLKDDLTDAIQHSTIAMESIQLVVNAH